MTAIRFIWPYIREQKLWFGIGLLMTSAVSALSWLGPKAIAYAIDEGIVRSDTQALYRGVMMIALVEAGRLLAIFLSQTLYSVLGQNVIERVRSKMIAHLLKLPVPYFDRVTSGGMMTRVVNDANSMTDFFQSGFVSILGNFATILAIFSGLISIHAKLGLLLLVAFVPSVVACVYFSERLRVVYEHTRNQLAFLNSILADFLFGMKTIRSLGLSFLKRQKLNRQIQKYADAQMQMVKTFALFHPSYTLGIGVMMLLLVAIGVPMVSEQKIQIGEWVAALSYIVALQIPLIEISDRWNFFLAGVTSIDRIAEVMREPPEAEPKLPSKPSQAPAVIEFQGVSFHYPESKLAALENIHWTVRRGDRIGVFGESGSGKSTLLQMLYGFYTPVQGKILWNGRDYSEYSPSDLRRHFGVVEQFPFLFAGTVGENVLLFERDDGQLDRLLEEFKGYHLIESLLRGRSAMVTERGGNLSMGQRQMIAFLRAYRTRPAIWILDEATAFFDPDAEQEVVRALNSLGPELTLIQVAHRPEALKGMKQKIRVAQGRLLPEAPATSPGSK